MSAKTFLCVCAGILLLVVAYQVGVSRADAQAPGDFTGICVSSENVTIAIRSNGDVYARPTRPGCTGPGMTWCCGGAPCEDEWAYMGNVLGGPIQTEGASWGKVKDTYRK